MKENMFKYIYENDSGFFCYDKYFKYIEEIKHKMPLSVYNLASDRERYDISSKKSLHDSWLISLIISCTDSAQEPSKCVTSITLKLLGPFHDRIYTICYEDVNEYSLAKKKAKRNDRHNDLLHHEIRVTEEGSFEHVMTFDNAMSFFVSCSMLLFEENIL